MSDSGWKDALWNLLDVFSLRRLTARVALSAGLVGLAVQAPDAGAQPRVPVMPAFNPEATVRRFRGKYVLRRAANTFSVRLADHRSHSSHSSHSSHVSHSSHSSSSHYSGSHFSSSVTTPRSAPVVTEPVPAPPPRKVVETPPPPPPKPQPLLRDDFSDQTMPAERWSVGVIATPQKTFDPVVTTRRAGDALTVAPIPRQEGSHFSGYVSVGAFDLRTSRVSVQLRRAAAGATTIFAAAIDAANWVGFRVEGRHLSLESHTAGKVATKIIDYDPQRHRFLRLRMSDVAPVVVWETSADGQNWMPEYVETSSIPLASLRVALSAGTTTRADAPGAAMFDNALVERKR